MPLVKINLVKGKSANFKEKLSQIIHNELVKNANVPIDDKFQLINEYEIDNFIFDKYYKSCTRTTDLIIIEIILNEGRTITTKIKLFNSIAEEIENNLGINKDDVLISLQEVKKEDWSFGKGIATYL